MVLNLDRKIENILVKGADNQGISKEEAVDLLRIKLDTRAYYSLLYTANELSRKSFNGVGENHLHIGVNSTPCKLNCEFCSLATMHDIFHDEYEFPWKQILSWGKEAELKKSHGINLMTTGTYGFDKLLEIGKKLSKEIAIPLIANTRDLSHKDAEKLLEAGYIGMYHAVRLGEGIVTPFKVSKRINTIKVLNDVGLKWMNCIEPIGPEHEYEEVADLMLLARNYGAVYSGAMRRINFPGSPFEKHGMITEQEMAKFVAVSRLVMGDVAKAHCTHEPNTFSLAAGANLFFPEVGSSPRDNEEDTSNCRGKSLDECRLMLTEMGWDPDLESNCV